MPRPLRYGVKAVRRTVFLHPETDQILQERSRLSGRSEGELIDDAFRPRHAQGVLNASGEEAGRTISLVEAMQLPPTHLWKAAGKFGEVCDLCTIKKKDWDGKAPCPGKKEGA